MPRASASPEVLIAGAGAMAEEHLKALLQLGVPTRAIAVASRGAERADALAGRYGVAACAGADAAALLASAPAAAVVAVSDAELAGVVLALLAGGCRRILVEKPGALRRADLERVAAVAAAAGATVHVAYNRRFYPSVDAARRLIEGDGGLVGIAFDFTEIESLVLRAGDEQGWSAELLALWGVVNSSHVIDLALHLGGLPVDWVARRSGALDWHPSGAVFAGAGATEHGALFSYLATWSGAGRWGVELTTRERRLVLRPLEALVEQRRGRFELVPVEIAAEPAGLKPGFLGQLQAFLGDGGDPHLCSVDEALRHRTVIETMLGYA